MNVTTKIKANPSIHEIAAPLDVLVVGAGISGIGAARYLKEERLDDRFIVVEEMNSFGGTWLTHRYPGTRSDSDLYTFGYGFKPWVGPPIATADQILSYLRETIEENDLDSSIYYGWRVQKASWNSDENLWTLELQQKQTKEKIQLSTRFLWMCQGYYRHSEGYTPRWEGMDEFNGQIIHPQNWPESFEGEGKRMIVIGSGATAATLVPNVVDQVEHVTLLQRTPTYFISMRNRHETASKLRQLEIDEDWIHEIVRREILMENRDFIARCMSEPEAVKEELTNTVREYLGADFDVDTHFTPPYLPWRQRAAKIPDGDFFKAFAKGKASVVTDHIERFVPEGILLKSGEVMKADVIVTATGFNISAFGDIKFSIDGKLLDFHETVGYRGMMFTGVPNLVWIMGYFRASWTLRAEMIAQFVVRLLDHMQKGQKRRVTLQLRESEKDMPLYGWADEEDFNPGYLLRGQHLLPKRGATNEWRLSQDYWTEKEEFASIDLDDEVFDYG